MSGEGMQWRHGSNSNSPRGKRKEAKKHKGRIKYDNTRARKLTKHNIVGATSRGEDWGMSRYI